jgi:murein DD-endopeptidase MepM/ murein hydrolase activator NlpD
MVDVDYRRPCKTKTINDDFAQHVARGSFSPGVDYNCAVGEAIHATAAGRVVSATENRGSSAGLAVVIHHRDGRLSHYFHLSKVLVDNGQHVDEGQLIGKSGNTGTATTGPHLHFAIKDRGGRWIDPEKLLRQEAREARKEKAAAVKIVSDVTTPVSESPETITG